MALTQVGTEKIIKSVKHIIKSVEQKKNIVLQIRRGKRDNLGIHVSSHISP